MRPWKKAGNLIDFVLERFFLLIGLFLFSQFPMFYRQYLQRIEGHLEELKQILLQVEKVASAGGKSLDQYVHKFLINSDPDIFAQGKILDSLLLRLKDLTQAVYSLQEANFFQKPFIFFYHFHYDIGKSAFFSFQPGFILSWEGSFYGLLGAVFGYFFYSFLIRTPLLFLLQKNQKELID